MARSERERDRDRNRDWASRVPESRFREEYEDYGWEAGTSGLPEFRDPSVHSTPEEWEEVREWRRRNTRRSTPLRESGPQSYPGSRHPYRRNYGREFWGEDTENDYSPMGYYTDGWGRGFDSEGNFNVSWQQEDFLSGPYSGQGPKNYHRSDERIEDDINERMTRHGHLDARNLTAHVKDGLVTLDGTVHDRRSKRLAEDLAESVRGVVDVQNNLRVQNPENITDRVGRSGVYPASGPMPEGNAEVENMGKMGRKES